MSTMVKIKVSALQVTQSRIYLDHNATSPLRPEARAACWRSWRRPANASSVHAEGRAAKAALERARAQIARGIGTAARNVIFTSGATEAANLALTPMVQRGRESSRHRGLAARRRGSIRRCFRGIASRPAPSRRVALTPEGALSLDALDEALARHAGRRVMLALQAVNNETGVIQPVARGGGSGPCGGGAPRLRRDPGDRPDRDDIRDDRTQIYCSFPHISSAGPSAPARLPQRGTISTLRIRTCAAADRSSDAARARRMSPESPVSPRLSRRRGGAGVRG